ncbi:uncharacterized protein LOC120015098 [Tripterygium wilfordii]|uniref:uncharacterized protein LOC120015098 n=1 Tax=Tripterygium wilfordii TaxID=458696 RepID=UPI0018F7F58B|nr:uncharacterized protein LOC120015098 [Tripterygium wilfordii]
MAGPDQPIGLGFLAHCGPMVWFLAFCDCKIIGSPAKLHSTSLKSPNISRLDFHSVVFIFVGRLPISKTRVSLPSLFLASPPISMESVRPPFARLDGHSIPKAMNQTANVNWVNLAGPYAWVKYVPGEPILPNNPNEGSVKRRNEKKRMRQRCEFIKGEAKKRKAQLQEANRKKRNKRVERKMAAVARERAWTERLAELQLLEVENGGIVCSARPHLHMIMLLNFKLGSRKISVYFSC